MNSWIVVSLLPMLMVLAPGPPVGAQQPEKVRRIGSLSLAAQPSARDDAFKQSLRDLGWVEGRNITIESRWA